MPSDAHHSTPILHRTGNVSWGQGLEIVTKGPRDANAWVGLHGDASITLWQCHFCGPRDRHYLFSPSGIQDPPALLHLQWNSQIRNAPRGRGDTLAGSGNAMAGSENMLVGLERNVQAGFGGTPAQLRGDMLSLYTESHHLQAASWGLGGTHC